MTYTFSGQNDILFQCRFNVKDSASHHLAILVYTYVTLECFSTFTDSITRACISCTVAMFRPIFFYLWETFTTAYFISRDNLRATPVTLATIPPTFDVQVVRLVIGAERFLLANIYRPPNTNINDLLEELSGLHEVLSAPDGHPIFIGDFNCPGDAPDKQDMRLVAWLSCYDLIDLNIGPTRMSHDILSVGLI